MSNSTRAVRNSAGTWRSARHSRSRSSSRSSRSSAGAPPARSRVCAGCSDSSRERSRPALLLVASRNTLRTTAYSQVEKADWYRKRRRLLYTLISASCARSSASGSEAAKPRAKRRTRGRCSASSVSNAWTSPSCAFSMSRSMSSPLATRTTLLQRRRPQELDCAGLRPIGHDERLPEDDPQIGRRHGFCIGRDDDHDGIRL